MTRFWDVVTGAQKKEMPGEQFTFSKGPSDKKMAGKYVVTKQGDLVLEIGRASCRERV